VKLMHLVIVKEKKTAKLMDLLKVNYLEKRMAKHSHLVIAKEMKMVMH
jgi:hypothetical protein